MRTRSIYDKQQNFEFFSRFLRFKAVFDKLNNLQMTSKFCFLSQMHHDNKQCVDEYGDFDLYSKYV